MAGFVARLRQMIRPKASGQIPTAGLTAEELLQVLGMSQITAAGIAVTPEVAMRVSTVYACVTLISGAIASLPIALFDRTAAGKKRVDAAGPGNLWWLLNEQANDEMSSYDVLQYLSLIHI